MEFSVGDKFEAPSPGGLYRSVESSANARHRPRANIILSFEKGDLATVTGVFQFPDCPHPGHEDFRLNRDDYPILELSINGENCVLFTTDTAWDYFFRFPHPLVALAGSMDDRAIESGDDK